MSDVYVFNKVAATLSFTRAATQIGSSRSAVSKKISRLERDLGVVLLNRSTRSVGLTEAGRTFHQHTSDIDRKIERAADAIRSDDSQPTGSIAFTIPSSMGAALMPVLITQFESVWPELKFNIHLDDHVVELIEGNFDVAIRVSKKLDDSNLISRRLASTRRVLAASPGYLERYGTPKNVFELREHRCLGLASPAQTKAMWRFQDRDDIVEVPCNYSNSANSNLALILAATLDDGIVYMPEIFMCNELAQQSLQIILPEFSDPQPYGIYAVLPHRKSAEKIKVFIDFIERELAVLQGADRSAEDIGNTGPPKANGLR